MKSRLSFLILALSLASCQSNLTNVSPEVKVPIKAGELPAESFAKQPLFEKMKWSRDGKTTAYIQNDSGKSTLITTDLYDGQTHKVFQTENKDLFIKDFSWVNNERLLVKIEYYGKVNYSGLNDLKFYESTLFAVNKDGTQPKRDLIWLDESDILSLYRDNFTLINDDPNHVFIENDKSHPGKPDVYKLDVYTGSLEKLVVNDGWVRDWVYDRQGNVRVASGYKGTTYTVAHRFNSTNDWKTLSENESFKVLGFDENPDILYITAPYNGRASVFKLNLKTNARELVLADKDYDIVGSLIRSSDRKQVIGINYLDSAAKVIYFDPDAKELQRKIDKILPTTGNIFISSFQKNHLVYSSNTNIAPRYYLYDETTNTVEDVAEAYPDLKKELLTESKQVLIRSRDGINMEAYLTQPSKNNGKPAPTIIFPHGGPWSRDFNTFDTWTQLFANRGWNVLQVNFRGSTGFGETYLKQGFKQWGLKMQDDIVDATKWTINNNIADKQKICIVGASYGGYAALMGVIKYPDLYQCAVSFAAVTDLTQLVKSFNDPRYVDSKVNSKMVENRIGDWWSDSERLKATSPVNLTKSLTNPLLIAHGLEDRTVPVSHSRKLVSELKDNDYKNFEYLELKNSDHYLRNEQESADFFRAMDSFLKRYL